MPTNTSRVLDRLSDFPHPSTAAAPTGHQVHDYLRAYAYHFQVTADHPPRAGPAESAGVRVAVDGEPFDAVVIASGRFRQPHLPGDLGSFRVAPPGLRLPRCRGLHRRRTLVYGNGISGHEIASDLARQPPVIRLPQAAIRPAEGRGRHLVGLAVVHPARSVAAGSLARQRVWPASARQVLRIAGNPADFGAPAPDPDILVAGHSLSQDSLAQVAQGAITCRPAIAPVDGGDVTFTDGRVERVEAIICATGYALDLPYLSDELRRELLVPGEPRESGGELRLYGTRCRRAPDPRCGRSAARPGAVRPAAGAAGPVGRRPLGRGRRAARPNSRAAQPHSATGPGAPAARVLHGAGPRAGRHP